MPFVFGLEVATNYISDTFYLPVLAYCPHVFETINILDTYLF